MNLNYQQQIPQYNYHQQPDQAQLLSTLQIQRNSGSDMKRGVPGIRDLSEERELAKQQRTDPLHSPRNQQYSQSAFRQQRVMHNPLDKFSQQQQSSSNNNNNTNSSINNSYDRSFRQQSKKENLDSAVETLECQWMSIKQQHGNFDTRSSSNSPAPAQKINGLKNRDLSLSNLICYEPQMHSQQLQQQQQQQTSEKKNLVPVLNIVKPINIINKVVPHSKINLILGNDSSRNLNNSMGSIVNMAGSCGNLQLLQQSQQQINHSSSSNNNNFAQQQQQQQQHQQLQNSSRDVRNSIEDQRAHLKNIYDKYQNVHKKKNPEQNQMLKILKIMENKQEKQQPFDLSQNSLSIDNKDSLINSYRKLSQQNLNSSLSNSNLNFQLSQFEKNDLNNIVQQQKTIQYDPNFDQNKFQQQQLQQQQQQSLQLLDKKNYHKRQGSYNQDKTPKKLTICNIIPKREEYNRNNLKVINQINFQDVGHSTELSSRRIKLDDNYSNINLSSSIQNLTKEQTPVKLITSSSQSQNLNKQALDKQNSNSRVETEIAKIQQQSLELSVQEPSSGSNSRLINGINQNQIIQKNQETNNNQDFNIKKIYPTNLSNLNLEINCQNKVLTASKKPNVNTQMVQPQPSPQNNQLLKKVCSTNNTIINNNINIQKSSTYKENQQISATKKPEVPKQKFVGLFSQEFAKRGSVANKNEIIKNPPIPLFK